MTIPSTPRKAGPLLGTGAQTAWPFSFKVFAEADIRVVVVDSLGVETDMVLDSDYSVSLNSNQDTSPGGTVTYPISGSPLTTGSALTIVGDLDYDQPYDVPTGGNFNPTALENELDRIVMQAQQLREILNRALLAPVTSAASGQLPAPEANTLIGWNSAEDALQNIPLSDIATAQSYGSFTNDPFTGDGAETTFALTSDPVTLSNLLVIVDGRVLTPVTDYTLATSSVIFTVAPSNGAEIIVRYGQALVTTGMAASDVSFTPTGNIAAVTVQAALAELDTDKAKVGALASSGITGAAASGSNVDITSLSGITSINGGQLAGLRNKLINGNFDVWQRGTSFSPSSSIYTADRWNANNTSVTNSQVAAAAGSGAAYFMRSTVTNAANLLQLDQPIESHQCKSLHGKNATFALNALCSSGTVSATLLVQKNSTPDIQVGGSWSTIQSQAITITTADTRFNVTAAIPADGTAAGIRVRLTFTNAANGVTVDCYKAQLEEGSVATFFEYRPYGLELALCQRYYIQYAGNSGFRLDFNGAAANYQGRATFTFPVQMRASPTMNSPTSSNTNLNSVSYAVDNAFSWYIGATAAAAGNCVAAPTTAITFTAEL